LQIQRSATYQRSRAKCDDVNVDDVDDVDVDDVDDVDVDDVDVDDVDVDVDDDDDDNDDDRGKRQPLRLLQTGDEIHPSAPRHRPEGAQLRISGPHDMPIIILGLKLYVRYVS
jgi:hypothetical protein